ncbi:MAG: glycosyltransferase [Gemmatimonadetes bacterium]|nr:glycosyltransferase [Gemmatimonadota bacterium]
MLRVLWITHVYPRDEDDLQGLFLHRLARELPARGVDLRILSPRGPGSVAESEIHGVAVRRFEYPTGGESLTYTGEMHRVAIRRPWLFMRFVMAMIRAASSEVSAFQPSLVHAHWWFPGGMAARWATRTTPLPYVVSLHGTDVRLLTKSLVPWPLARWTLSGASSVLPVSSAIGRELARLRVPIPNLRVLPMPADGDAFRPSPVWPEHPSFLVPARLAAQKRVDDAIRAFSLLIRSGIDASLHLVGEGERRAELERLVQREGLVERVTFHGFVPQSRLADLTRGATAVVLPSVHEGYGLVLVEAALCGRPAIGVRSGAIQDFIVDRETGFLIEPGDCRAMADAMIRMVRDPERCRRMGEAARRRAVDRTSAPLAERLIEVYERTLLEAESRTGHSRAKRIP